MNEIEAQECYDAIGILLAHRDALDSLNYVFEPIRNVTKQLMTIRDTLIDFLPCECKIYTVTNTIRHNHDNHLEVEVTCNGCGKVGLKLFGSHPTDDVSWDS